MASIVERRHRDGNVTFKVQWRQGGRRGAPWQSETFQERRFALKFQAMVDAAGQAWPEGWVKGVGLAVVQPEPPDVHPLSKYAVAYVRRLTSAGPDTQSRYTRQIELLCTWLREVKGVEPTVQNVTEDDDRDWINLRRRAGASPKTIANYHGLLAAVFGDAVRKGLIGRNPCADVRLPRRDDDIDDEQDKVFLAENEFALLHGCVSADAQDLVLVAVGTGLRWGELSALKAKDLALDAAVPMASVRRAWKRNGDGEFARAGSARFYLGMPKTKESRRQVTLAPRVVEALRRVAEGKSGDDLLFTAPRGGRLDQAHWYESRWKPAVTAARTKGLGKTPRFHDLRHTHAAWLISAGVPLPVIQKRLGHKSIQITVDVYGGLLYQTHEVADLAIQRALGGEQVVILVSPLASAPAGEAVPAEVESA
ncbi:MAG: tyrosine-type recombinase/integrase [Mycobacteriales bacterium]